MWKFSAIASLAAACTASAANFYVAPGGSDLAAGSQAQPWATIQHACEAVAVQPGDTILVQPGTYHEKIQVLRDGVEGSPITLKADGVAILDGTGVPGANMILLAGRSYFRVEGFEIRNNLNVADGSGIRLRGSGRGIELRGNTIHDIRGTDAMGITCYGDSPQPLANLVIDGNTIRDCEPAQSESLVLNGNIDGFAVTNNVVRDVNNIGIDFIGGEKVCRVPARDFARNGVCSGNTVERANSNYGGGYAAGIYVDGAKNIVIEQNQVSGCDVGIEVGAENRRAVAEGITVRSNLIFENKKAGLGMGGYAANTGRVRNSRFSNNTIVNNQNAAETQAELWIQFCDHCAIENNIIYSDSSPQLVAAEGTQSLNVLRNNLYFFSGGSAAAEFRWKNRDLSGYAAFQSAAKEPGAQFADPLFKDRPNGDYELDPASTAIDASSTQAWAGDGELDFYGNLRQCGVALDTGAFELQEDKPGLAVSGKDIQLDGQTIRLRGVAVGDPILAREGRPLSDYQTIANDWKANIVRISLHPTVWKHPELYDSRGKDGIVSRLRAEIDAAMAAGMMVLLDWHTIGWPDGYFEATDPAWEDPPDYYDSSFAVAKDFWARMASEFGNEGRVIFELWNEPNFSADDDETVRWATLKPYWQDLTAIIRAKSNNVILAAGSQWAHNLRTVKDDLLADANTAYAWHIYAGDDFNDETLWSQALDNLFLTRPVIVSEWGFQANSLEHFRGSATTFGNKFRDDFLQGKNLHFTAWCWHPDWGPTMLRTNWKSTTPYGTFVRTFLRSIKN